MRIAPCFDTMFWDKLKNGSNSRQEREQGACILLKRNVFFWFFLAKENADKPHSGEQDIENGHRIEIGRLIRDP